jgi:hypothetical protein
MDQDVIYQDLEPMIEAQLYDPLPEGLVEPESLELPEIERDWLELPEIEPQWLQAIEEGELEHLPEAPDLEQGFDLEH